MFTCLTYTVCIIRYLELWALSYMPVLPLELVCKLLENRYLCLAWDLLSHSGIFSAVHFAHTTLVWVHTHWLSVLSPVVDLHTSRAALRAFLHLGTPLSSAACLKYSWWPAHTARMLPFPTALLAFSPGHPHLSEVLDTLGHNALWLFLWVHVFSTRLSALWEQGAVSLHIPCLRHSKYSIDGSWVEWGKKGTRALLEISCPCSRPDLCLSAVWFYIFSAMDLKYKNVLGWETLRTQ